jgi:hypothetical protein
MTNTQRSLAEEALSIGWFILATQMHMPWIQNTCAVMGGLCMITAIVYALKE